MLLKIFNRGEVNILDKSLYLDILHNKGLTCEKLAEYMKISRNALSKKLNGHIALYVKDIILMCEFAGIDNAETICKIFYISC